MLINQNNKEKLYLINSYLLIGFGFVLPISVAITNVIMGFIVLNWVIIGDYKKNYKELKNNKVVIATLFFIFLHIIGLLWTTDIEWGINILRKELKFLLLPIFIIFVRKEHIKYYILAFLSAMTLSEIISYSIWFDFIEPFKSATKENPTPFMSHSSYNPFLAFAFYILLYKLFFEYNSPLQKFFYIFFMITMSINMFITGGRAGQIAYFIMLIVFFLQYFRNNRLKAFSYSFISIILISSLMYNTSEIFSKRVTNAVNTITDFENNKYSSSAERIEFAKNTFQIIENNLFYGVGTGDFPDEYKKVNKLNSPDYVNALHPHNMYLLITAQLGILGLLLFISIFYYQIKISKQSNNDLVNKLGIALPLLFLVIMLSDSYLLGHFTTMLFVFFSAIIYKDYTNETI